MSMSTETLEPELERNAPPDAPLRFEYDTPRTTLVVRVAAAIMALPFAVALATRSTGMFALVALLLAIAGGLLLFLSHRRLSTRAASIEVTSAGLSLGGRSSVKWSDIMVVQHSLARGGASLGTRSNGRAVTVDMDLAGYTRFLDAVTLHISASRSGEEPPSRVGGADALFSRSRWENVITYAMSLAGAVLGLVLDPAYLLVTAIALPRLLTHWLIAPSAVAVDDTAVWIVRPFARDAIPLRAIRDVALGTTGRVPGVAVIIDHHERGSIAIRGLGADALPLFDAVVAARMRAMIATRTGPAAARTGSAIRLVNSRRSVLMKAGTKALAFVAVCWLTVLTGVPLRTAARLGNEGFATAALMLGSPVRFAGLDGSTALHHAAAINHSTIARAILERGADVSAPSTTDGITPLHVAAAAGNRATLDVLIDGGADVNARSAAGRTALAQAALAGARGDVEIAGLLLDAGADPAIADDAGRTPLHHAALNGHAALIRRVGRAGVVLEVRDTLGERALHAAVQAKHADAVAALINADAEVDARGSGGRTALAAASAAGAPVALVNLLLEAGAGAAIADDEGWNAVQLAVRAGNIELLELFARSRASLNATDGRIAPALWLAAERGNTAAARALLRGGASPYVRWNGRRAIDVARSSRNTTLLALMQMR